MAFQSREYLSTELLLSDINPLKARKHLSNKAILSKIADISNNIPGQVKGSREDPITLTDCIMSALAMFGIKSPSMLNFDRATESKTLRTNLERLYSVNKVPSDTYSRQRLDDLETRYLRKHFTSLFAELQRGKVLEDFRFLDEYYIVSMDGSGHFESQKVFCDNCCVKNRRNGTTSYYHNVFQAALVHPFIKTVFPFASEPITKKDGQTKNDSDQVAAKRFLDHLKREHPHLKVILTADSLHATGPLIKKIHDLSYKFILNVKPGSHKKLFKHVSKKGVCQTYRKMENGEKYRYRFVNGVSINDSHPDVLINYLECKVTNTKGKVTQFTWATDIEITKDNIHQLMRGGRARWRIENETFNTLKNQGYKFEHNFGHGYKNLSTNFSMLMLMAFFIDQVQQHCNPLFQAALKKVGGKYYLWEKLRSIFFNFLVDSWETLWKGIAYGHKAPVFTHDTS